MTLRDQIVQILAEQNGSLGYCEQTADAILALLSEGPTPTQIEAASRVLFDSFGVTDNAAYAIAEAVLRAASEATP